MQKSPTQPNVRQPLPHEQSRPFANVPSRPPLATPNSKAVQQKPSQARPSAAQRTRETAAPTAPRASTPAAPPVYRPRPVPAVLQRKESAGRPLVRANQTPPMPVAAKVSTRPTAPPVYRPQSAPKVLQAKPALPASSAPRSPTVKPSAGLRQPPAPPQAPRPFQPPAAPARPRPAAPARSGVLQLMEVPHNDSGSDDYSWAEDIDYEAQRKALEEIGRKAKEENKSSSNVNQSSLRETNNHLDKFSVPKEIFGKDKSGKEPSAEQVSVIAKAGGSAAEGGGTNTEHDEEIRTPSNDVRVINSKTDGEVAPLIAAMRAFLAFLKKPSNQKTPQHFTVALLGSWGACDGCK